ncbi:S-layer protein [Candidatus Woesearchaeota archaeon]|nr:S-layer protein [Candidatus Woesearchaeota archaeon]
MKFGKAIKKIVALGTTATMLGATLGASAFAADLKDFPAPFIKDGKFSGLLVVGDKAAAEDVVGVSDVAISLQFAATKKVGTGTSSVTTEGDIWRVGTSSNQVVQVMSSSWKTMTM